MIGIRNMDMPKGCHIEYGDWTVTNLPKDLEPLKKEIEECVNENIPQGCCGGCI